MKKQLKLKSKTKESIAWISIALFVVAFVGSLWQGWMTTSTTTVLHAQEPQVTTVPSTTVVIASPEPTEIPEITPQYEQMRQIVIDVFGDHADKAFRLLECENRSLNPNAVNDNRTWGGVGVDRGLFQINDYWQGIRHEGKAMQFLFDPEINARIAWRLYVDSGYSFNLWTCGKNLGI